MADIASTCSEKSLDDFFAKRDKKKKKEKGKAKEAVSAPGSVITKKNKKEKEKATKNEHLDMHVEKEDEEWKEFEQKEVDYSGLRLQALQMSDEREEEEYEKEEIGEDGEVIPISGDKVLGPWNKTGATPASVSPVEQTEMPEAKPAGLYRPPGARQTITKRGLSQGPPEIFSDTQFPSLSATTKHIETRKDREIDRTFEVVKHRNRAREESSCASAQELQLDNQYAVLGDK